MLAFVYSMSNEYSHEARKQVVALVDSMQPRFLARRFHYC